MYISREELNRMQALTKDLYSFAEKKVQRIKTLEAQVAQLRKQIKEQK